MGGRLTCRRRAVDDLVTGSGAAQLRRNLLDPRRRRDSLGPEPGLVLVADPVHLSDEPTDPFGGVGALQFGAESLYRFPVLHHGGD